ncbi:MAG: 2-polyprenylphenol 6-hydroxylase [Beijerinckiaceae bacterium]
MSIVTHLGRLSRLGFVLAREGALALIDPEMLPGPARFGVRIARLIERRTNGGPQLAAALTRLGPSYVKLGQFLATRPDVVGMPMARNLETLQDKMPPFPDVEARRLIVEGLGQPVEALFAKLGPPIAAASVAQVHKAVVEDANGPREVAVKVLRPGVRQRFARDLETMRASAAFVEWLDPKSRRLRHMDVVETLARSVAIELDLRMEASALSEFAQNTKDDPDFRLPKVDWERTGRDVLTTEWIDGTPMNNLAAIDAAGYDRVALGRAVIQSFLRHALRDGFFHADMHQGNLFVDRAGQLVAVDFGIMGRIGMNERRFLAEILFGFITRDYRRVAEVHFEAGYVPARHSVDDFAQAIRAIGEPIHNQPADKISMAKLLTLLFEVTEIFDMQTRTELVMLQKTMVVVEGVARSLDPQLDMWKTAEPVVREWIERNLGPLGKLQEAGSGVAGLARAALKAPELVARGERLMGELETAAAMGFALSPGSVEAIGKAEARRARWGNAALWVIAALLAVVAWRIV